MTDAIVTRIPNKPGELAKISKNLGDANVNITAFACTAHGDMGTMYVMCDDLDKARNVIEKAGKEVDVRPVLSKRLTNKPGALAEFTRKLADEGVNVREAFGTVPRGNNEAEIWFDVENPDKVRKLFQ